MTHVLGLNDEQVAVNEFEHNPNNVDDVVFPSDRIEGHRVDVLVEDEGKRDDEVKDIETLSTDVVRQDLDGVRYDKGCESDIVEAVVEEDERNDGVSGCLVLVDGVLGRANGLE